eukprot:COSAG06_NODE_2496_length_6759_cov_20.866967_6_plen_499_part_00
MLRRAGPAAYASRLDHGSGRPRHCHPPRKPMSMRLLRMLAVAGVLVNSTGSSQQSHLGADPCDALRRLAGSTRPHLWRNASGWIQPQGGLGLGPCCDWHGVECSSEGAATALKLYGNQLEGTLPSESFGHALPELRLLSVGYGNLSGTLPSSLAMATKLEILDARVNFLSGSLPQLPSSLRFLSLHFNLVGGTFPSLTGLRALQTVDMVHNHLSGTLASAGWSLADGGPVALELFDLGYNSISGTVPAQLGALSHVALRVLGLGPNQITHVDTSICPVLANASAKHLRCGLAKLPLLCPVPLCVQSAPLHCGAVCRNATTQRQLLGMLPPADEPQPAAAAAAAAAGPAPPLPAVEDRQPFSSSISSRRISSKRRRSGPPPRPPPLPPTSTLRWTDVSPGGAHTCGLLDVPTGPNMRCWGSNTSGQLGPPPAIGTRQLQQQRFMQVSASDGDHTCALRAPSGLPVCFGLDNYGQATLPPAVAAAPQEFISTGRYHSCGE